MTPEEKDQLLDRYIAGYPMTADEEAQIQQLLRTDADVRDDYRLQQTLYEAGIRQRRAAWEARQQAQQAPARKQTAFPMRWAAAASVILLLGLGLIWWARTPTINQPLTGQAALFEQGDTQIGFTPDDSSAVGQVTWFVTKATANTYEFEQADTLRIFSTNPSYWRGKTLQIIRLSEVRYQLRVADQTYLLEQGRSVQLPLKPQP